MRLGSESDHQLELHLQPDCRTAFLDEAIIRRILSNLLSNAIKYSLPGGEVSLSVKRDNDNILIEVADQGEGIVENELARIFDRYYRVSETARVGGTGLGLSIVKAAVEAHHGTIQVESRLGAPAAGLSSACRRPPLRREPLRVHVNIIDDNADAFGGAGDFNGF